MQRCFSILLMSVWASFDRHAWLTLVEAFKHRTGAEPRRSLDCESAIHENALILGRSRLATAVLMGSDHRITSQSGAHVNALKRLMPEGSVFDDAGARAIYGGDAQSRYSDLPLAVVLPRSTKEVASAVAYCQQAGIKVFPRGGGTSMVGGAVPAPDGIVLCLSRMNRVLETDFESLLVRVEAGMTTAGVSEAVRAHGFRYLPDPASALASSIAGNVATNASGARALRDGATMSHVAGLKIVLMDGEVVEVGAGYLDAPGYDLLGLMGGSEGQLGIVTEVTLRIAPLPPKSETLMIGFGGAIAAGQCLAAIVASGILPAAIAYLERAAITAVERYSAAGFPNDVAALLLVDVEGTGDETAAILAWLEDVARPFEPRVVVHGGDPGLADKMWRGQRSVYAAIHQASEFVCAEGVVPMSRVPGFLARVTELGDANKLRVVTVMQGGDGCLNPFILYDADNAAEADRAERLRAEILALYVEVGGSISGELGIGLAKRDQMSLQFSAGDLALQARIAAALDPARLLNPGKVRPLDAERAIASRSGKSGSRAEGGLR
jgi:glycolate dehydrogenase FAD-linked subunit